MRIPFRHPVFQWGLAYLLIATVASGFFLDLHRPLESEVVDALRKASMYQLAASFAFLGFLGLHWDLRRYLDWAAILITTAMAGAAHANLYVPLMHNPSMAATFVVLATRAHPLALIAILYSHSWTAFLSWAAATGWALRHTFWKWDWAVGLGLACGAAGCAAYTHHIPDNGRFALWSQYLAYWSQLPVWNLAFGTGPGTTRLLLPLVNYLHHSGNRMEAFVWAHNDWLQELVELGGVGISLAIACAVQLFRLANEEDRGLILAYGVAMVSNFPTHWPLTALVGWSLFERVAISRKSDNR